MTLLLTNGLFVALREHPSAEPLDEGALSNSPISDHDELQGQLVGHGGTTPLLHGEAGGRPNTTMTTAYDTSQQPAFTPRKVHPSPPR